MSADARQNLNVMLDNVNDEASFIAFVAALGRDFELEQQLETADPSSSDGAGKLGWENGTVDSVLGAAAAWGCATLVTGQSPVGVNPWRRCAQIVYAGKYYE